MFAIFCGFLLALIFFGLPMGIIGLFVVSILDQRSPEVENIPQDAPTSKRQRASNHQLADNREMVGIDAL